MASSTRLRLAANHEAKMFLPSRRALFASVSAAVAAPWLDAAAADAPAGYDLVIRNGKIVDGTGNPWFYGDVAIAATGSSPSAGCRAGAGQARDRRHAGWSSPPASSTCTRIPTTLLLEDGRAQSKIRQGVTPRSSAKATRPGRRKGKLPPTRSRRQGKTATWTTLGGYFDALDKAGISVNVASYVGLDNVWQCVMGKSFDRPTAGAVRRDEGAASTRR